ncbi:DMT family transporter [Elioraea sp.]|uniref:DMT family transporter n=1 Tax=Elioraea sp. TaxID=2185103 RepID=UPI003F70D2A2
MSDGSGTVRSQIWLLLGVVSFAWGSSFLLIKLVVEAMPPFALAAARSGVAAVALALWLALGPRRAPAFRLRDALILGTTNGWLPNVLTAVAVARIDTALAAMIQAATPLMVALIAHRVLAAERLTARAALGLATGFGGIGLLIGPDAIAGATATVEGAAAMLVTALCYAVGTVYARWMRPPDPASLACAQQAVAAVAAGLLASAVEPASAWTQPLPVWGVMLALGAFASALPMALFLRLLILAPAAQAATVGYLQPVWAAALGILVLGERLGLVTLLGGAVVLGGVALVVERSVSPAPRH